MSLCGLTEQSNARQPYISQLEEKMAQMRVEMQRMRALVVERMRKIDPLYV